MSGLELILGALVLASIAAGAGVLGYATYWAGKKERPKLLPMGIVAAVAGVVLGFAVAYLVLILDAAQS